MMTIKEHGGFSGGQCPGECYDSFWEDEGEDETRFNVGELYEKYREKIAPKYVVKWMEKGEWMESHYDSMGIALAEAHLKIAQGYTVDSVFTVRQGS